MKTTAVHSRIEPELKQEAESVLKRLGVSPTEAIRMFYTQISLQQGLPFAVKIPNAKTKVALQNSREGHDLEGFDSLEELAQSWEA